MSRGSPRGDVNSEYVATLNTGSAPGLTPITSYLTSHQSYLMFCSNLVVLF